MIRLNLLCRREVLGEMLEVWVYFRRMGRLCWGDDDDDDDDEGLVMDILLLLL